MNISNKHYLKSLFSPSSIAVFGASDTVVSVGHVVFKNLSENGFKGELYAINPKREKVGGQICYPCLAAIGKPIELAVITTPAPTIPQIIEQCGEYGIKMAIIISAGFREVGAQGVRLEKSVLSIAKRYGLRFVGPNCLGIVRPQFGFNATFIKGEIKPGNLALISQSGALCSAVLDWADINNVGFSTVISLGTSADIDFGEVLDYLVLDPHTQGILMYIEGIRAARSFMSALRAAARIKPVIVIKSGRHEITSKVVLSHSGVLVGHDASFDAALQRAGVVRVNTFGQLFAAAVALASRYKAHGNRLAIVTNGGGPGVMATDRATDLGIPLAALSPSTIAALNKELPPHWSHNNPVDIVSDATTERYQKVVSLCLQDPNIDGLLVVLTPQAMAQPLDTAKAIIELAAQSPKPLLVSWMGGTNVKDSRRAFMDAHIPQFRTPEAAVEVFYYLSAYHQNQQLLLQTPASLGHVDDADVEGANIIIESVLAERRKVLTEMESKALLGAFRIPVGNTAIAHTANEALVLAQSIGFPIAMKINSPDIAHKVDAGGVKLNITSAHYVREAFREIMHQVQAKYPDARLEGVTIESMSIKPNGRELMVGMKRDPTFGPIITFGMGGSMVEVIGDTAVSLPPLNSYLVNVMIDQTRVSKLLGEFRNMPAVKHEALEHILLRISEMACELPHLQEMDINPLIIDEQGAVAVDARIVVDYYMHSADRYAHMAIYPYPTHLVTHWQTPDGIDVVIRPIRPEDAEKEQAFIRALSDEARYFRFMQSMHELTPTMLVRFTQIDYDREMALIAVVQQDGQEVQVGVCRYAINPDNETCEFAIVISDLWQNRGFAHKLMNCLMDAARARGMKIMQGEVLSNNQNMLRLMDKLGFVAILDKEDRGVTLVTKIL